MVLNRIITKFFQLDEKRALQVDFHPIGSNIKPGPKKWLQNDTLLEIQNLLHDLIKQFVSDIGKSEKKSKRSNQIITGNTVLLGCVFRQRSNANDLLIEEGSDDESVFRSLYGQKLIVYVCPNEQGSPSSGSELYKVMARGDSSGKIVKISTYFSKTGGSGTLGSGLATGATSSSTSSSSTSHNQKDVIKNIIKRGKMSKHKKKMKSVDRRKEERSKLKQQELITSDTSHHKQPELITADTSHHKQPELTTSDTSHHKQPELTTSDTSHHKQPELTTSDTSHHKQPELTTSDTSHHKQLELTTSDTSHHKQPELTTSDTSHHKQSELLTSDTSHHKQPELTTSDTSHHKQPELTTSAETREASSGLLITSSCSGGTITHCDVSSSSTNEPSLTADSAEQIQELNLTVIPCNSFSNTSVLVKRTEPLVTTSNPSDEDPGQDDDSNDSILPSCSFIQQKSEEYNSDKMSDSDGDQFSPTHPDFDNLRFIVSDLDSASDDNLPLLSSTWRRKSPCKVFKGLDTEDILDIPVIDSDSEDCLIALKRRMSRKRVLPKFPEEDISDEEVPHKKQKYITGGKSSKPEKELFHPETTNTFKSSSVIELPSLSCSRRRSPQKLKQTTLELNGGSLSITKSHDPQPSLSQQEAEQCMMIYDEGLKHLRSDLKQEIIHAESVKDLNEQHMWFLVQDNKKYLRNIFEGKIPCERHKQFKQGGRARFRLNYQVYLSLFTDEQQDIVMEALMSIFCKKDHGFLDYVMKVMLPEMLIKIYMNVTGLNHDEVDGIMARGGDRFES
ncbi:uncharacterized protein LOC132550485 [Ylistrum balloti]|uniref:uncharacterized protein LOC132550485 n=1 Tax=Ylistrum balloti TaxID=509963 RepID=UPI002905BFC1|nr:uncharacterized protein LOC132550485 [Ylistrum balloti]